jgi:hypothetical protein
MSYADNTTHGCGDILFGFLAVVVIAVWLGNKNSE